MGYKEGMSHEASPPASMSGETQDPSGAGMPP